jgi:hypothetical protein
MKTITTTLAALLFAGILGLSVAPVIADEVDTEPEYALGFMQHED